MRQIRAWLVRLRGFFNKGVREQELSAEMESHLEMHIEDNLRAGMTAEAGASQGYFKARRDRTNQGNIIGNEAGCPCSKYSCRISASAAACCARTAASQPSSCSLSLSGVGANTAIFGLVNGLLLQRLPVPSAEQIVALVIQSGTLLLERSVFPIRNLQNFASKRNRSVKSSARPRRGA